MPKKNPDDLVVFVALLELGALFLRDYARAKGVDMSALDDVKQLPSADVVDVLPAGPTRPRYTVH